MSKILVIVERFYPEDFLVNDLVAEWKRLGDEVEVLTQVPSYPFDRIYDGYKNKAYQTTREYLDIPVHRVSTIFGYNTSVKRKVLNYLHFGWMTFWWALWNGRKYDRVFVYHTAALTRLSKKKRETPALLEFPVFLTVMRLFFPLHHSVASSMVLPSIFGGGWAGRRKPSCDSTSATSSFGSP